MKKTPPPIPGLPCSHCQKQTCTQTAKKLYELSCLARKEGLLALANTGLKECDAFLRAGIETMLDTLSDETLLAERLHTLLAAPIHQEEDAFKHRMIVIGLLGIHGNMRPDQLAERLQEWLVAQRSCEEELVWKL